MLLLSAMISLYSTDTNIIIDIKKAWRTQREAWQAQCEQVEYTLRWTISRWLHVGHDVCFL